MEVKCTLINSKISIYQNDPSPISIAIKLSLSDFKVADCISGSPAAILLSVDDFIEEKIETLTEETNEDGLIQISQKEPTKQGKSIDIELDLLNSSSQRLEMSLICNLPDLVVFVTQEQVDFFLDFASVSIPQFPADLIVDEPFAFQYFELNPSNLLLCILGSDLTYLLETK